MSGEHKAQGSTRNEILQLLRRNGQMTASELSCELGVGAVGVRQHLALMCSESLVVAVGVRRGLGRPSHLYSLTPQAEQLFPKAYDRIALDALSYIAAGGREKLDELFDARRRTLSAQLCQRLAGDTIGERVAALTELLNEQGYMCDWSCADDGAIIMTEHNCPIDCVARAYPQACSSELRLYEELLGVPLKQEMTIADGAASCRYRVVAPGRAS